MDEYGNIYNSQGNFIGTANANAIEGEGGQEEGGDAGTGDEQFIA